MEIKVYDKTLEPVGTADEMNSVIWQPSYWAPAAADDFSILAPITDNNRKLFVKGNILILHGEEPEYTDENGKKWKRAAQIRYRRIAKDEKGVENIEVQGSFIKKWLSNRIIIKEGTITGTNQKIITELVKENCTDAAGNMRAFKQFVILPQEELGGSTVEYAREYGMSLSDAVYERALVGKLGYDILVNDKEKLYGFWLYKGRDLSAGNTAGNDPCIFSRDSDNVNEQEYEESDENEKNVAYVIGAAGDDAVQPKTMAVKGDEAEGIDRRELFVEATDIARKVKDASGEETPIPTERYDQLMKQKGEGTLEEHRETMSFSSTINASQNLQYKKDFVIGDIVTSKETKWGITIDARITKIKQTFQGGKKSLDVTFGDSIPTLAEQIKKAGK